MISLATEENLPVHANRSFFSGNLNPSEIHFSYQWRDKSQWRDKIASTLSEQGELFISFFHESSTISQYCQQKPSYWNKGFLYYDMSRAKITHVLTKLDITKSNGSDELPLVLFKENLKRSLHFYWTNCSTNIRYTFPG